MPRRQATVPGDATISRFALVAGLVALAIFTLLSALVGSQDVPSWELETVRFVVDLPAWLIQLPRMLMYVSTRFTVPVLALAAYLVTLRWRAAAAVFAAFVVGSVPTLAVKHLLSRPRPSALDDIPSRDDYYGSGYASGHVMIAVAAAAAVAPFLLVMPRDRQVRRQLEVGRLSGQTGHLDHADLVWPGYQRWLVAAVPFILPLGVAVSRLYVGAHYPADLIGGALAGLAGAWLILALPYFNPRTQSSVALLPDPAQRLFYWARDLIQRTPGFARPPQHLAREGPHDLRVPTDRPSESHPPRPEPGPPRHEGPM